VIHNSHEDNRKKRCIDDYQFIRIIYSVKLEFKRFSSMEKYAPLFRELLSFLTYQYRKPVTASITLCLCRYLPPPLHSAPRCSPCRSTALSIDLLPLSAPPFLPNVPFSLGALRYVFLVPPNNQSALPESTIVLTNRKSSFGRR